ncbi:hypothetical protein CF327_g7280 [Tilletia walkeri]|nr:hypothetical protein CF327_g7280 [Tilletia walkeri]
MPSREGVSGYVLTLPVAFAVMNNRTVDGLEAVFFDTLTNLAEHDFHKYGITVRNDGGTFEIKSGVPVDHIFVEDPTEPSTRVNCARTVRKWGQIAARLVQIKRQLLEDAEGCVPSPLANCFGLEQSHIAAWSELEALELQERQGPRLQDSRGTSQRGRGTEEKQKKRHRAEPASKLIPSTRAGLRSNSLHGIAEYSVDFHELLRILPPQRTPQNVRRGFFLG